MVGPQPLFVLGLGRSGTTVLTRIVTAHPKIAIGMERYKRLYLDRDATLPVDLFNRGRFFDFSDGLTNLTPSTHQRWAAYYRQLESKWDSVDYVGDKFTAIRIQQIWRAFPTARFLCIVRDIEQVAASWGARAHNPTDAAWSEEDDARRSVVKWNQALRRIRRGVRQQPDLVAVVEYGRFFGDPVGASLKGVLSWLDLDRSPETDEAYDLAHTSYVGSVAPKARTLLPEDMAYLDEHADLDLWRELVEGSL